MKIQIQDWFPSSPRHCFLSRTLQRQPVCGILVDLHAVDCFNIQAVIWFVTILTQKVNLLVCNNLGKLLPDQSKQQESIPVVSQQDGDLESCPHYKLGVYVYRLF